MPPVCPIFKMWGEKKGILYPAVCNYFKGEWSLETFRKVDRVGESNSVCNISWHLREKERARCTACRVKEHVFSHPWVLSFHSPAHLSQSAQLALCQLSPRPYFSLFHTEGCPWRTSGQMFFCPVSSSGPGFLSLKISFIYAWHQRAGIVSK